MAWIAGDRVVLRSWEREDVQLRWDADQTSDTSEIRLRDWHEPPRSLVQREQEFEAEQNEPDATVVSLIIQAEGRAVGDINFFAIDTRNRNAEVGLSIWRAEDRCRGYGTDAMRAMLRWGFRHLNLHRVQLSVSPQNAVAVHVYEKLGFVVEGRRREHHYDDGCYQDEVIMGLLHREFEAGNQPQTRSA
jgi:RimJ/RimL family protein N-acetyltransferase